MDCSCGRTYVEETAGPLKFASETSKSHQEQTDHKRHSSSCHNILWKNAEVICFEAHWYKRKVQAALWIR